MARGALMGARGYSGVILSQIWRGIAAALNGNETISGTELAQALQQESKAAYQGLSIPVEGTILTVMREAALSAQRVLTNGNGDIIP